MMMSVFFSIMIIILIVKRYEKITFWAYKFMIKNEEINRSKSLKIVLYFYLIFVFTASAFQISKAIFINESITQYQQLKSSISPYIDNQEILLIDSSFSRIKNKNDYEVLINKMEEIEKQSSSADLGL